MTTIGRGLTIAGAALANALIQRKEQKRKENRVSDLIDAMMPQAFPEQMPGYEEDIELANAMIPQAPLKLQVPMDPSKDPMAGTNYMDARNNIQGAYDRAAAMQNQDRETMRALMMSGPQGEQIAMSRMFPAAQKPMSVAGGYLDEKGQFVRTEGGGYDIIQAKDGTVLGIDPDTLERHEIFKTSPENKTQVTTTGVDGKEVRTLVVTDPEGNVVKMEPLGDALPQRGTTVNVNTGDQPPLAGDAPFLRKAQADISSAQGAVRRIERIENVFQPFFQSAPGQATTWSLELVDRLLPKGLPEGSAKDLLAAKTSFAQYTNENMNLYIKMITGAQMSEAEASRLSKAIANLGDSPTQFATKLANSKQVMAEAAKILEEELNFYAGVKGMDYEEALKYAQKRAANHIRLGLADIESEAGSYDSQFGGGKRSSSGLDIPSGWREEIDENGNIRIVKD